MTKLEELKAAWRAATGGIWMPKVNPASDVWSVWGLYNTALEHNMAEGLREENAQLIALMHNTLPALLGAVGALDNLVGQGAQHEHTCDKAEHDADSGCFYCEARAALEKLK